MMKHQIEQCRLLLKPICQQSSAEEMENEEKDIPLKSTQELE